MGIGKRAFLYVTRKKVRSILLFLIFLVSALFLLTGISIKRGAKDAAEDFKKTLITGLKLDTTMPFATNVLEESFNEKGEKVRTYTVPFIYEHHIKEFLAIEGVSGFYCDNLQSCEEYTGLTLHPGHNSWALDIINGKTEPGDEMTEEEFGYMKNDRKFYETGAHINRFLMVYDSEWHPAFINGGVTLVEGTHIRVGDQAKVIISDEVAEKNGLKVGDKITAREEDPLTTELYGSEYETEIAGIFHINFEQDIKPEITFEDDILANTFFSTPDIERWSRREYQTHFGYDVFAPESQERLCLMILFLEDSSYWDSVRERLLEIDSVDWDLYEMGVYDKDYQTAAAPLFAMMKISNVLAAASLAGVLLILSLVLTIWMRSRTHEIGILSSIGIKKNAVLLQFILECCAVAAAAFLAAFLLSGPVTELVGDGLQSMLYASGDTRGYEVEIEMGTDDMFINLLPPAKGEALTYAVTSKVACLVFMMLMGTAVLSVLVSFGKTPGEILGRG